MTKKAQGLLVEGYVANALPTDIIGLVFKWYYVESAVMTYSEVLDVFLRQKRAIYIYDFDVDKWIPARYIRHWDNTQRIMIDYKETGIKSEKYRILEDFPINYARADVSKAD